MKDSILELKDPQQLAKLANLPSDDEQLAAFGLRLARAVKASASMKIEDDYEDSQRKMYRSLRREELVGMMETAEAISSPGVVEISKECRWMKEDVERRDKDQRYRDLIREMANGDMNEDEIREIIRNPTLCSDDYIDLLRERGNSADTFEQIFINAAYGRNNDDEISAEKDVAGSLLAWRVRRDGCWSSWDLEVALSICKKMKRKKNGGGGGRRRRTAAFDKLLEAFVDDRIKMDISVPLRYDSICWDLLDKFKSEVGEAEGEVIQMSFDRRIALLADRVTFFTGTEKIRDLTYAIEDSIQCLDSDGDSQELEMKMMSHGILADRIMRNVGRIQQQELVLDDKDLLNAVKNLDSANNNLKVLLRGKRKRVA